MGPRGYPIRHGKESVDNPLIYPSRNRAFPSKSRDDKGKNHKTVRIHYFHCRLCVDICYSSQYQKQQEPSNLAALRLQFRSLPSDTHASDSSYTPSTFTSSSKADGESYLSYATSSTNMSTGDYGHNWTRRACSDDWEQSDGGLTASTREYSNRFEDARSLSPLSSLSSSFSESPADTGLSKELSDEPMQNFDFPATSTSVCPETPIPITPDAYSTSGLQGVDVPERFGFSMKDKRGG